MRVPINRNDALHGLVIYAAGDTVAALIQGRFLWWRLLGMMLVGGTVYALEIPAYFRWIDRRTAPVHHRGKRAVARTALAMLYFNPLWIARHLLFIAVFSADWDTLQLSLLRTATLSWIVNIPLSLIGNLVIQVVLPLSWRFVGSATFSGLMAVYYALSGVWFHATEG